MEADLGTGRQEANLGAGKREADMGASGPMLRSSIANHFRDAVKEAELFGFDAMVGDANDEQGTSTFGHGNVVLRDPYQHSELMRSRRDLRLKRGAARAMDRRTGAQNHEGP